MLTCMPLNDGLSKSLTVALAAKVTKPCLVEYSASTLAVPAPNVRTGASLTAWMVIGKLDVALSAPPEPAAPLSLMETVS